ncbi:MAG: hypothetical protein ACI7YS_10330 [Flavobacterium sp.]
MDAYLYIGLLVLIFVGFPIGIGLLFYFVPKKLGYPKTAKYLTIAYGLFVLAVGLFIVFEDQLFTKNNAKELIEEQDIKLTDEFELLKNESISAIGDYYHTFTLKISERDKQDAISKIKSADNFKADNGSIETLLYQQAPDRYFGKKVTQNYETEKSYVREYFEPSGREGYAPTFRRISISKTEKELTFEDINE